MTTAPGLAEELREEEKAPVSHAAHRGFLVDGRGGRAQAGEGANSGRGFAPDIGIYTSAPRARGRLRLGVCVGRG
jgi:hypothetical protein